jgi:hypothetical protein
LPLVLENYVDGDYGADGEEEDGDENVPLEFEPAFLSEDEVPFVFICGSGRHQGVHKALEIIIVAIFAMFE